MPSQSSYQPNINNFWGLPIRSLYISLLKNFLRQNYWSKSTTSFRVWYPKSPPTNLNGQASSPNYHINQFESDLMPCPKIIVTVQDEKLKVISTEPTLIGHICEHQNYPIITRNIHLTDNCYNQYYLESDTQNFFHWTWMGRHVPSITISYKSNRIMIPCHDIILLVN